MKDNPGSSDRPDFTRKADVTIIEQVKDLKLIYDETKPLAINIAKMVAEKLTVMAPSLQAVSVGEIKSNVTVTYDSIPANSYGSWKVISGRAKLRRIQMCIFPTVGAGKFSINQIGLDVIAERGTAEERDIIRTVLYSWEYYDGKHLYAELKGTPPGTYFLRNYYPKLIRWIHLTHESTSFDGYHDENVKEVLLILDLELEFEDNVSIRVTNYSSYELMVWYLIEWGAYP